MKKLIISVLLSSASCLLAAGQVYVQGVNANEADILYVELRFEPRDFGGKYYGWLDYGQHVRPFGGKPRISTPDGDPIEFNSPMDALNFVLKRGWRLVEYSTHEGEGSSQFRCLLRKKNTAAAPSLPKNPEIEDTPE